MGFIDDQDKILDFFTISKSRFLKSYLYISESDYADTVRQICNKIKFNDYDRLDYTNIEGIWLRDIVASTMAYKFLNLLK